MRKQAELHGFNWIEFVYIRIQLAEIKLPQMLPFIGKLQSGTAIHVNYAATQLIDSDISMLETCISPTVNTSNASATKLQTFQLSPFTLAKLSSNQIFRFGSIFHRRRDIEYPFWRNYSKFELWEFIWSKSAQLMIFLCCGNLSNHNTLFSRTTFSTR